MSDEIKKVKKQVEVNVVEMKIEVSEKFFDNMDKAKKQVADKRGFDMTYGEYIEEAMEDLVKMLDEYGAKIMEAHEIIQRQDQMLGLEQKELVEEEPVDPDGEPDKVPDELYAHIVADEDMRVMYQ